MASTSKEEKPTAPLLPAVQPKSTRKHSTVLARREWVRIVRRWICIISIQISAPGIVYYTYFYLFCIIPYFLLWNPVLNPSHAHIHMSLAWAQREPATRLTTARER